MLERVLELDFDVTTFAVPWNEITSEERNGLKILKEERDLFVKEQHEKQQREQHR